MPIIKHIPIYAAPKRLLSYVTNEKKTEKTLVTGLNCSANASEAYEDMKFGFEMFSGERFFKRSIKSETAKSEKQKIRLHHYIQSFKPSEVTPDEAHQIGVEWAERAFGKKAVVLCATHTDRGHIHNHFAVCPYDIDGKHWHANKESLRKKIADEKKLIGDIPKYLEILKRRPLLPKDISELAKYNYLKDAGITSLEDAEKHRLMLADMKSRLEDADGKIREAVAEKKTVSDFYALYENQMKSDYQVLLEQAKAEMENIRREEERQKAEEERSDLRSEDKTHNRNKSGFLR